MRPPVSCFLLLCDLSACGALIAVGLDRSGRDRHRVSSWPRAPRAPPCNVSIFPNTSVLVSFEVLAAPVNH